MVEKHYLTSSSKRAKAKIYREANRKRLSAYQRTLRRTQPDRVKGYELKKDFGITLEYYNDLRDEQGGVCAICSEGNSSGRALAVDHDHNTNKVRGLLCDRCNRGLGLLGDDPGRLKRAASYIGGGRKGVKVRRRGLRR